MTVAELEHFRNVLLEREGNLEQWLSSFQDDFPENAGRVRSLLTEIATALARVDGGSFGECSVCHGEVETHRLEVQPVRQVCLDCISQQERSDLEEELKLAGQIHRALLPQRIESVPGIDIAVRSQAARTVGGDYYDFLPSRTGGESRVVIGDVMGKGLPAGLMMSNLQGSLRVLAEQFDSPATLVSRLNRWVCRNVPVTKFVSLVCMTLGPVQDKGVPVRYANAGHCPPMLIRENGDIELLEATGTVIGVHEDFRFDEGRCRLVSGDLLLLYTDGVTEAMNPSQELFSDERLSDFIRCRRDRSPDALLSELVAEVCAFSQSTDLADDLTVMAVRCSI